MKIDEENRVRPSENTRFLTSRRTIVCTFIAGAGVPHDRHYFSMARLSGHPCPRMSDGYP